MELKFKDLKFNSDFYGAIYIDKFINIKNLPKIHKHELSLMCEGIGSTNPKEYCKCVDCKKIKERRDLIYNKPIHKIKRWFNNNF